MTAKVNKTDAEWKATLSPTQFKVLRKESTERAGTGPLSYEERAGTYRCGGCQNELFPSDAKFDSGTGWPSFFDHKGDGSVETREDRKLFMVRTEVHCEACGGHLGHLFPDGPQPTGLRYCMNSAAMEFVPEGSDEVVVGAADA